MKNILMDKIFILLLCLSAPVFYLSCADSSGEFSLGGLGGDDPFDVGRLLLKDHDIVSANEFYTAKYTANPSSGDAAVGFAFTQILLLPYDPSVTGLIKHLGGSGALNANRDLIFERDGLISLLAQGTPFEDQGGFSGITSLLLSDLPWTEAQLNAPDFWGTISTEMNTIVDDFVEISDTFVPIIKAMEVGINDPHFSRFEMPGEVFFNDQLTLSVNRADLAFASSILHGIRGGIRFIAAYDHAFKVSDFGKKWEKITPQAPEYKAGYTADDYLFEFIDSKALRTIRKATHLSLSGREMKSMLQSLRKALDIAKDEQRFGALSWNLGRRETLVNASTFLKALERAVDQPTQLPFITPRLTLDLSRIFKDGKALDAGVTWYTRVVGGDYFLNYTLNQSALELFLEGVFTPSFSEIEKSTFHESKNFSELTSVLLGHLNDDFNNSFGN